MNLTLRNVAAASFALGLSALVSHAAPLTTGMTEGTPALKSIGPLAFGPDGVLFARVEGSQKGRPVAEEWAYKRVKCD